MDPVYTPVVAAVSAGFRLFGQRIEVLGAEHVPRAGGAVIATNHVGYLDFTYVGYAAKPAGRYVRFLAKREIFDRPGVGALMHGMRHIPVDRYGKAVESYAAAVAALGRGEVLGMFPEATISPSFVPMAGKTGAARMAAAAGVPLVPGAVWGSQRLMTKGRPVNAQWGVAIVVSFGEPLHPTPQHDPGEVTRRLMGEIASLLDDAQARYPQRPSGDADRWWLPAHLGGTAPTVEQAEAALAVARAERKAARAAARGR